MYVNIGKLRGRIFLTRTRPVHCALNPYPSQSIPVRKKKIQPTRRDDLPMECSSHRMSRDKINAPVGQRKIYSLRVNAYFKTIAWSIHLSTGNWNFFFAAFDICFRARMRALLVFLITEANVGTFSRKSNNLSPSLFATRCVFYFPRIVQTGNIKVIAISVSVIILIQSVLRVSSVQFHFISRKNGGFEKSRRSQALQRLQRTSRGVP